MVTFTKFLISVWLIICNNAQQYNQNNAKTAVYYSYAAYCNPDDIETFTCKWCEMIGNFSVSKVIMGDELLSFIGYDFDNSRIVLSFRGTHNIEDWVDDFEFRQTQYPLLNTTVANSYIHRGFYKSWNELSDAGLTNAIIDIFKQYKRSDILVTGHSLGGAGKMYLVKHN